MWQLCSVLCMRSVSACVPTALICSYRPSPSLTLVCQPVLLSLPPAVINPQTQPGALAEENALAATLQVSDAFDELMLAHKKEVHCNIITAEVCTVCGGGWPGRQWAHSCVHGGQDTPGGRFLLRSCGCVTLCVMFLVVAAHHLTPCPPVVPSPTPPFLHTPSP